jgi:hypothetical protein
LNFKILLGLFILSSCGVKGNPVAPTSHKLPSVLENYPDIEVDQPLKDSAIKRK